MMTDRIKRENGKVFVWDGEWGPSRSLGFGPDGIETIEVDGGWLEIEPTPFQRLVAKIMTFFRG